jgi:hypothetical protein
VRFEAPIPGFRRKLTQNRIKETYPRKIQRNSLNEEKIEFEREGVKINNAPIARCEGSEWPGRKTSGLIWICRSAI